MEAALIVAFSLLCLVAISRRWWALSLVLLMHPIEQVMQAHSPVLRSSIIGSKVVNVAIGVVVLGCIAREVLKGTGALRGWWNVTLASSVLLFAWSVVTLGWSPGRTEGLDIVVAQLPYFLVVVVASSMLAGDADDLTKTAQVMLILGTLLALIAVVSPAFATYQGRLSFEFGAGIRSNTLAIGELGGMVLITAACLRRGLPGGLGTPLRIAGLTLGTLLALKAGARGQFFLAIIVAVGFVPVAAPIRSFAGFFGAVIGIAAVAMVAMFLSSTLEGFAARRFSMEEMLYGASSAGSRAANLTVLVKAWLDSPAAILFGLGYNTFATLDEGLGDPYSHILFADAICELGVPGAVLLGTAVWTGARSATRLLSAHLGDARLRAGIASMVALLAYEVLLVNKQGALWGIAPLFPLMAIMTRAWIRETDGSMDGWMDSESDR
jgi:hypothetical protein